MPIIIDTNFILTCVKQKIDLFEQLREKFSGEKIIVPAKVTGELSSINQNKKLKTSEREAAVLALQLLDNERVIILDLQGNVDDSIVNYASKNKNIIVASLDRGIKSRLKNTRFLTIRKKKRVCFV